MSLLARQEREATVELIGHLAVADARKLHLPEGYGSLFAYCTKALRLSEHAAYNRIEAARLCRRFPDVLDLLAEGVLNLATARLLSPHLRPDNFEALVAQAGGRSKREVEEMVAALAPRPDVAASVRRLPERNVERHGSSAAPIARTQPTQETSPENRVPVSPAGGTSRPALTPLAPERYLLKATIGAGTQEKLRRAQDLLRREIPDGDPGAILDRALTLLLEDVVRRKAAQVATERPRPNHGNRSRHVPAPVKRAVLLRDGERCAFVAKSGRRCAERTFLEFHHREPYALGGNATPANISLRCRAHNAYEAEVDFGRRKLVPGRVDGRARPVSLHPG